MFDYNYWIETLFLLVLINRQSIPCCGEKIKAMTNNIVVASTMTAPDDKLYSKLKYRPMTAENAPKKADNMIIVDNRLVNKYAVDAGVINIATTRTTPTVCSEATVDIVSRIIMI